MQTFGIYQPDLELTIKYKILSSSQAAEIVEKYESLGRIEYIFNVLQAAIVNMNSEVRPALKMVETKTADQVILALYNGCVMLNPILDISSWYEMSYNYDVFDSNLLNFLTFDDDDDEDEFLEEIKKIAGSSMKTRSSKKQTKQTTKSSTPPKKFQMRKDKLLKMPTVLKSAIIGQDEAIDKLYQSLKRHQAGLSDEDRPVGVFLFCGHSGSGKTLVAKELHQYLFGASSKMIRIDCGEYQHKHENQKLLGSPNGYSGSDEPGFLAKALHENEQTIFLIDEVEKAHHDFWDTFLRVFDEGMLTDARGNLLDFRQCIFILTSNLGNDKVLDTAYSKKTGFSTQSDSDVSMPKRSAVERATWEAIRAFFRPELLSRIDEVVIFNHLSDDDYLNIANLQFQKIADKLAKKSYSLKWTEEAIGLLSAQSKKNIEGARGMAKIRRSNIEDPLASLMLTRNFPKGTEFEISTDEGQFIFK